MRPLFTILVSILLLCSTPTAAKEIRPVKVIAPDLIIESVEQGAFFTVDEKTHRADPRDFKRTDVVPHRNRYLFGWRMKVKTTRKSILVQERDPAGKGRNGVPARLVPTYGYIFRATDLVSTLPPGRREYKIFVENQPIKHFSYILK